MQAGGLIIVAVVIIIIVGAIIIFAGQWSRANRRARIKRRTRRAGVDRRTMIDRRTRRANGFGAGINAQKIIVAASVGDTAGDIKGIALVRL